MIRHIFLWQAAEPRERATILDLLAQLSHRLPMIRSWELGAHIGEPNANGDPWDGALITDFDSWEDLAAYSDDPFHNEIVQQLLPLVRSRAVVDFVRKDA
ncbi:Dabb family protein [Herbiconiux sp.]|uniref:Dabb family protein n=1 Tax=Herbiconiux sp. TaxID=1871186 RepID=UPI0025BB60B4|nr:Dabb family protein [Herbiconiux sp.]